MTTNPMHTPSTDLRQIMDKEFVNINKIRCIKIFRGITGEGLKETKDFVEKEWIPFITKLEYTAPVKVGKPITISDPDFDKDEILPAPMFFVGHAYKQEDGNTVLVLGTANTNTIYETVFSLNEDGNMIHRYNRRDFGRVTDTDDPNYPQNFRRYK